MNDLIKYGLLAVGGWLLYSKFVSAQPAATTGGTPAPGGGTPPAGGGTPPSGGGTTPPPSGLTPDQYCAVAQKALAAAGGPGTAHTADDWNYYWSAASGVTQTADLFPSGNRSALMSWNDYLAARTAAGIGVSIPNCAFKAAGDTVVDPKSLPGYYGPQGGSVLTGPSLDLRNGLVSAWLGSQGKQWDINANPSLTVAQWNNLETGYIDPFAKPVVDTRPGASQTPVTADAYVLMRTASGLSGLGAYKRIGRGIGRGYVRRGTPMRMR